MSDNELYTYFKDRSSSYNEMPDDKLWAKIENGLKSPPTISANPAALFIKIGIAVLIAGIASVILLNVFSKQDMPLPVQTESEKQVTVPAPNVKAIDKAEATAPLFNDTVKKKKGVIKSSSKKNTANNKQPDKQKTGYIKFQPLQNHTDTLSRAKLQAKLPEFKTQVMPGRVVVTGKGSFGKKDFDLLTQNALKAHKEAYGSLIVVKAAGHQTFRHKVPDRDRYMIMSASLTGVPLDSLIIKYKNGKPLPPSEQRRNKKQETKKTDDSINNNISYIRFLTQSDSLKPKDPKIEPQDPQMEDTETEFDE